MIERSILPQHAAAFEADLVFEEQTNGFGVDPVFFRQDACRQRLLRVVIEDRHRSLATIGPVSMPSFTMWTVHPVNFTPCSSACLCASSPGNEGSNAGWIFRIRLGNSQRSKGSAAA